jgi:Na+/proline symporter
MVNKYYAVKSETVIKKATIIASLFSVIIGCGCYFVGSLGRFFVPVLEDGTPQGGFDYVVPNMLNSAFGATIWGNILMCVVLLCVLSASMSTLSAIVLTSSSAISVDLLKVIKPDFEKKKQMILTRTLCFVFVALSFLFATFNFAIIVSIMSFSWGVVSGCFIGPYIWGLYSKKITRAGAWAGLLSGITVVLAFVIYGMATSPALSGGLYEAFKAVSVNSPLYGVVAMIVSFIAVPVVSVITKKLPDEIVDRAFNEKTEESENLSVSSNETRKVASR